MHVSKQKFAEFEAYWLRLQAEATPPGGGGVAIPTRRQFNPTGISALLPYIFILEFVDAETIIPRLTGTAIDDALGRSIAGKNIVDLYKGEDRAFFLDIHNRMIAQPCGAVVKRQIIMADGVKLNATSKNLPLKGEDGVVRYNVGLMSGLMAEAESFDHDPQPEGSRITDFYYIDVGAGVPELPLLQPVAQIA
jgi:hypothetical protein